MRLPALVLIAFLSVINSVNAEDIVKKLIADLNSEDFAHREEGQRVIRELGEAALPDLRTALEKSPNPEMTSRLKAVIAQIEKDTGDAVLKQRRNRAVLRAYNVRDLLESPREFSGPSLAFGDDLYIRIEQGQRDNQRVEQLVTLVKTIVDPKSWDGELCSISIFHNSLVINQSAEAHLKVETLLKLLREDAQPQLYISCVLLKQQQIPKDTYSAQDFAVLLKERPDTEVMRTRLLCSNQKRATSLDGKQIEYVAETFHYIMEGGGGSNGVRPRSCLQGNALSVMPRINAVTGTASVELRFFRNSDLAMRDIGALEKWIISKSGKSPAVAEQDKDAARGQADTNEQWRLPSGSLQSINTVIVVPRDVWMCAGRLQSDEKTSKEKPEPEGMYLYVRVEPLEAISIPQGR